MSVAGDPRWKLVDHAEPAVSARFASRGVAAVRFVGAFPDLPGVGVWLCTTTDAERDDLRADAALPEAVRDVLREVGFSPIDVASSGVVVESQQTVDREYGGNWFFAMR